MLTVYACVYLQHLAGLPSFFAIWPAMHLASKCKGGTIMSCSTHAIGSPKVRNAAAVAAGHAGTSCMAA